MVTASEESALAMSDLRFDERGLIPCVVQDAATREVLMVAWMNADSLKLTERDRTLWFWSRSRRELWHKGATSGNFMHLERLTADCDGDTLLAEVVPDGPACHTGSRSCFFQSLID